MYKKSVAKVGILDQPVGWGGVAFRNFFSLSINVMKQPITEVIGIQLWPQNILGGVTNQGTTLYHSQTELGLG